MAHENNRSILFVENDPDELETVNEFRALFPNWDWHAVSRASAAIQFLATTPLDALVVSLDLPHEEGPALLRTAKDRFPQLLRIAMAGPGDKAMLAKCAGLANQQLPKGSTAQALQAALNRGFLLHRWMLNESTKRLVSGLAKIPSVPSLYFRALTEVRSSNASIEKLASIVSEDMVMTGKMLQLVNSAFFGLRCHISSSVEAVMFLGMERIKSLILLAHVFSYFDPSVKFHSFSIESLWRHSIRSANLAKQIAEAETNDREIIEETYTAGIIHDIGQVSLAANLTFQYDQIVSSARREKCALSEIERRTLQTTHAEVGACLIGIWGLPISIIEAVAFHHAPSECASQEFAPLTAVHLADGLLNEVDASSPGSNGIGIIDHEYLERLGLANRVETWRKVCQDASN